MSRLLPSPNNDKQLDSCFLLNVLAIPHSLRVVYLFRIQSRVPGRLGLQSWKIHDTSLCTDLFFPLLHNRTEAAPHWCGFIRGPQDPNQVSIKLSALNDNNIILKDSNCGRCLSTLQNEDSHIVFRHSAILGVFWCIFLFPCKTRPNEIIGLCVNGVFSFL